MPFYRNPLDQGSATFNTKRAIWTRFPQQQKKTTENRKYILTSEMGKKHIY